jgi:hypothetical protein
VRHKACAPLCTGATERCEAGGPDRTRSGFSACEKRILARVARTSNGSVASVDVSSFKSRSHDVVNRYVVKLHQHVQPPRPSGSPMNQMSERRWVVRGWFSSGNLMCTARSRNMRSVIQPSLGLAVRRGGRAVLSLAQGSSLARIFHEDAPEFHQCLVPRAHAADRAWYTLYRRATRALAADFRPFPTCPPRQ